MRKVFDVITGEMNKLPDAEPLPEMQPTAEQIRADRDARIATCDWTQVADTPLSSAQKTAWKAYRQALRDVPEQAGFPGKIDWPVSP